MVPLRRRHLPSRAPAPSPKPRGAQRLAKRPARPCAWISAQYAGAPAPQPSGPSSWRSSMPRPGRRTAARADDAPTVMRRPLVVGTATPPPTPHLVQSPPVAQLLDPLRQRLPRYTLVASVVGSVATSVAVAAVPPPRPPLNPPPTRQPGQRDRRRRRVFRPRRPALAFARMEDHPDFDLTSGRLVIVQAVIVAANRCRPPRVAAPAGDPTRLRDPSELARSSTADPSDARDHPALVPARPEPAPFQGRVDAPGSRSGVRSRRSARRCPDASVRLACPLAVVRLSSDEINAPRRWGRSRSRRDLTRTASGVPSTTPRRSPRAPRGQSRAIDRGPHPPGRARA